MVYVVGIILPKSLPKQSKKNLFAVKVKTLWEGHKIWKKSHFKWQNSCFYSVASKQVGDIFQIFVAFSEKLNFMYYGGTLLFKIDNMFFLFQAENGHYIKANQKWEKSVEM